MISSPCLNTLRGMVQLLQSSSESEEVDNIIKICIKCPRFIKRECKISWNRISLNVPSQSDCYHAEGVQPVFSAKGKISV